MCIQAQTVINAIAAAVDPQERSRILAADRAAVTMLKAGLPIAFADGSSDLYQSFEAVALALDGENIREADRVLERIDRILDSHADVENATDVACSRWTPVIAAAYHVGLCLGIRLAGNSIPATSEGKESTDRDVPLDDELSSALTAALAASTPAQRLTVLTILETPDALAATEGLICAIEGAR